MSGPRAGGIYSGLLRLYPRRFRDDYGVDMALLLPSNSATSPPAASGPAASSISPSPSPPDTWRPT